MALRLLSVLGPLALLNGAFFSVAYDSNNDLFVVAGNGQVERAKALVKEGADVNAARSGVFLGGRTPLHAAALHGHLTMAKWLVSHGARVKTKDNEGRTPADVLYCGLVHGRVQDPEVAIFLSLLNGTQDQYRAKCRDVWLMDASVKGDLNWAKLLVQQGANVSYQDEDDYGYSPLHYAAIFRRLEVAKYLVNKGANVHARDHLGETPMDKLFDGLFCNDIGSSLSTNFSNLLGSVAEFHSRCLGEDLMQAVLFGSLRSVKRLVGFQGANVNFHRRKKFEMVAFGNSTYTAKAGPTPLHLAAILGHLDIAKYLLERGAEVNAQGDFDETPLHCAAERGDFRMASLLLSHGADLEAGNLVGTRPWQVLKCDKPEVEIFELLNFTLEYLKPSQINAECRETMKKDFAAWWLNKRPQTQVEDNGEFAGLIRVVVVAVAVLSMKVKSWCKHGAHGDSRQWHEMSQPALHEREQA
mmetsp:Transcript_33668/g.41434  ORF Transcript_33668/g.41434 Transcript_33668/m.41434 type:complete len:470 (+) Transcript_33668:53-1462(+)